MSHLGGWWFRCCGSGLEIRLGCQQRQRFGWQGSGGRWLSRTRANLRPSVWGRVFGKLLNSCFKCRCELRSWGRLLAQIPHGPIGVYVKRVRGCWGGREREGEREGRARERGVSRYATVQKIWQLQAFQDWFTDGETLGVTLKDRWCLLLGSGSSICLPQLLLTTLPDEMWKEETESMKQATAV